MSSDLKLGILEWGFRLNTDSLTAVQQILDYAENADRLGFSRFWLTEHHNPNKTAPFTNPDILIALVAGTTNYIRVGSAGTLIKMYDPYHVVTNYKSLNNLFSERIDLGLAKGDPGSRYFNDKLYDRNNKNISVEKIQKIYDLFYNEKANFEAHEVVIPPYSGSIPQIWYLSKSYYSIEIAIQYKLNICRSIMHGKDALLADYKKDELLNYKKLFFDTNGYMPEVSLALAIVLEDSMGEAELKCDVLNKQDPSDNSIQPIPVTIDSLFELICKFRNSYGIDEFILYDMEDENLKKIDNLHQISSAFSLIAEQQD